VNTALANITTSYLWFALTLSQGVVVLCRVGCRGDGELRLLVLRVSPLKFTAERRTRLVRLPYLGVSASGVQSRQSGQICSPSAKQVPGVLFCGMADGVRHPAAG
jgi:hypothetical protein